MVCPIERCHDGLVCSWLAAQFEGRLRIAEPKSQMVLVGRGEGGRSSRRDGEGLNVKDTTDNDITVSLAISDKSALIPGDAKGLVRSLGNKQGIFLLGCQTRNLEF